LTLIMVLMTHTALLVWLAAAWHTPRPDAAAAESVQLMVLPSAIPQRIRADNVRVRRLEAGSPLSAAPPLLEGYTLAPETPSASGTRGGGSGVDWAAEARRALQAFEIRSHQPAGNTSVSRSSPAEQPWWPAHRPGERFKTADGNWIVWIDSSCYQVATSSASTSGSGPAPSTICPKEPPGAGSADPAHWP
jgi:hypothetical protein